MNYDELKKELKKFEEMYQGGPLLSVLRQARLAISDLEEEVQVHKKNAEDLKTLQKART